MDDKEVGKFWNENAENWTRLARMGYDKCRNCVNAPEFFKILPDITGIKGLDIGCGEGYNTRIAARKGAKMTAIDISEVFINHAIEMENEEPLGIKYQVASSVNLPFEDDSFDFVMSTMAFMDMYDIEKAFDEAYRVLKLDGFFQFSILHPCFSLSNPEWIYDDKGVRTGLVCRDYFENSEGEFEEWIFSAAPEEMTKDMKKFCVPRFRRTLSYWLNTIINAGFTLESFNEPFANDEAIKKYPGLAATRVIAWFLIIRCRK
ncbi:MAG: class I SAM-dependent methyltransferase [Candidatus Hodarchaeota archaeon]